VKKAIGVILALAILGGLGAGGWWYATRVARLTDSVIAHGYLRDSDWDFLATHPDDPRVWKAGWTVMTDPTLDQFPTAAALTRLDTVLQAHPYEGQDAPEVMAKLLRYKLDHAPKWIAFKGGYDPAVLYPALYQDTVFAELERERPKVSVALVAAVCRVMPTNANAAAHYAAGFPPDGSPFVALTEKAERVPPDGDPRIGMAFDSVAAQWHETELNLGGEQVWLAALRKHPLPVPPSAGAVRGAILLATQSRPDSIAVGLELLKGATQAQLDADVPANLQYARALMRARRGFGTAKDAEVILGVLARSMPQPPPSNDSGNPAFSLWKWQRPSAIEALAAIGPSALPAIEQHLTGAWASAVVSVNAGMKIDRHRCAKMIAQKLKAKQEVVALGDALDIIEAAGDEPALHLAILGNPGFAVRAAEFLEPRVDAQIWVKAFLDALTHSEVSSSDGYQFYLVLKSAKLAPIVARDLDERLQAADGNAGGIPWLVKYTALKHLGQFGGKAEAAAVSRFTSDPTRIDDVTTRTNERGKVLEKRVRTITIAESALEAIGQMKNR
jgi:hypothetical protein